MEDLELARRNDLGLNVERIKKNRALHRNVGMADLNAYFKVFHLSQGSVKGFSCNKARLTAVSAFVG
ncbi:MAG: hypothetical protein KAX15_01295 [Candidatus Omnitrophica bacterium]|nr:hypothetical protein [Candidatus Omnitrophota bacterium]